MNKAYLDAKLTKIGGHVSHIEKDYNNYKLHKNKQPEEVLIERAVETPIQNLYDKRLFNIHNNISEVLKEYLQTERRRPDIEELNDSII